MTHLQRPVLRQVRAVDRVGNLGLSVLGAQRVRPGLLGNRHVHGPAEVPECRHNVVGGVGGRRGRIERHPGAGRDLHGQAATGRQLLDHALIVSH